MLGSSLKYLMMFELVGLLHIGVWMEERGCLLRQQLLLFVVMSFRYRFALVVVSVLTRSSAKPALKTWI